MGLPEKLARRETMHAKRSHLWPIGARNRRFARNRLQTISVSSRQNTCSPSHLRDGMARRLSSRHRTDMFDLSREMIAYGIVGFLLVIGLPWLGYTLRKRKRERLRRRGIKKYGH